MWKKYIFSCLALWTITGTALAQNELELKKEINRIKRSTLYLYAEATLPTRQDAIDLATEMLFDEINKWATDRRKFKSANSLVVKDTSHAWSQIELPRGNMFRAFVYVKKSDILPAETSTVTVIEIEKDTSMQQATTDKLESSYEIIPGTREKVLNRILNLQAFNEVQPCLQELKQQGLILDYGRYAALQFPEKYVLIVYNRDARIEAILGEGEEERMNLKTNVLDNIANYKGRGAIGIQIQK